MKDEPLKLSVSKRVISGGKEVAGAELSIYPVSEDGRISSEALILHIPEKDGSCVRKKQGGFLEMMENIHRKRQRREPSRMVLKKGI